MLVCKYLGPEGATASLGSRSAVSIKFSFPKEYNDPYELYLAPGDFEDQSERAYFDYYLGELAQFPVTCFSHVPDSVVMWAHYGRDRRGVCLVFDEEAFCNSFDRVLVDDVRYVEAFPADYFSAVSYAKATGKARHMRFAMAQAYSTAYFTKAAGWAYERERRFLVDRSELRDVDGRMIGDVDPSALRGIVVGSEVQADLFELCTVRGAELKVPVFQLRCSRRVNQPLFLEVDTQVLHVWIDGAFSAWGRPCTSCGSPLITTAEASTSDCCAWCELTPGEKRDASIANLLGAVWELDIEKPSVSFAGGTTKGRKAHEPPEVGANSPDIVSPRAPVNE